MNDPLFAQRTEMEEQSHAQRSRKEVGIFCLLIFFISAIAGTLIFYGLRGQANFFSTPSQLSEEMLHTDRKVRLGGFVKAGSVHYSPQAGEISFVITDYKKERRVLFKGILPPLFREQQGVVAEGVFNKNGVFLAQRVLAKHDETYRPKQMIEPQRLQKASLCPQERALDY